jgi:glycine cleavage system aminomethyltransferase T
VLVAPALGPVVWDQLLEAGAPLDVACVGLDAIESLSVSKRLRA